jgi:hypothetical protein
MRYSPPSWYSSNEVPEEKKREEASDVREEMYLDISVTHGPREDLEQAGLQRAGMQGRCGIADKDDSERAHRIATTVSPSVTT